MINSTKYVSVFLNAQNKELKPITIKSKMKIINQLFEYLNLKEINTLDGLGKMTVYEFIVSRKWRSQTVSNAQFILRDFFNIMKQNNLSPFDGYTLFPVIFTNKRDRILSYYSTFEIQNMINCIDISFKCGVRDKCMVTIAAHTGLRASDIVFLKFDEINWDKNLISKLQKKTQIPVEVPITNQIKYLLLDYLKNHRPKINSQYIFINSVTNEPFDDAAILTSIVRKNFINAGISIKEKKAGAHSLRHSLATNMLKNNTPLPIITGILGHTTVTTTEKYISIDVDGLRAVSLEVPKHDNN